MAILKIKDTEGNWIEVPALVGKNAYQYAQEGGFTGTEEEFTSLLGNTGNEVSSHNEDPLAHADIREEINQLSSEIADIKDEMGGNYTNVLLTAVSRTDPTQILVGEDGSVGYLNKTRWSDSNNNYISASVDTSGLMPCRVGDIVYLRNVTMYPESGNSHCSITFYNEEYSWTANSNLDNGISEGLHASVNTDGNLIRFIIPPWNNDGDIHYFSVSCQDIGENSIITVNEEIIDSDDTRFTNIETSITELSERLDAIEESVSEVGNIPTYWRAALEQGVKEINTALCEAGRNKSAFLFYSDAHWNNNSKKSPLLLKYLYQNTGIIRTIFAGDIVANESTDYDAMSYLWEWRSMLKDLPNHHSVVGNHDDGNATNNLFNEDYVYGYLFAAEETCDRVMGDGMYYYIDSLAEKTRYLYLDTAYKGPTADQVAFIKESLINAPADWHIVVIAHIWYQPDYDQYSVRPIPIKGLDNGANQIIGMLDAYNARSGEYSSCNAKVEFCIGGHVHRDYVGTTPGGIPIIVVETDSGVVRSDLSYTEGTTTESSVNGVLANYNTNTVHVIRIGRGSSFNVDLTSGEIITPDEPDAPVEPDVPSVTNVIPLATTNDGVTIYNGIGYDDNVRWSGSSNTETATDGIYLTGYIPIQQHDVIRFANITMPNVDGNTCKIFAFKSLDDTSESALSNSTLTTYHEAIWDENGNLHQITINDATWNFIRVQCGGITESSIITINQPISNDDPPQCS